MAGARTRPPESPRAGERLRDPTLELRAQVAANLRAGPSSHAGVRLLGSRGGLLGVTWDLRGARPPSQPQALSPHFLPPASQLFTNSAARTPHPPRAQGKPLPFPLPPPGGDFAPEAGQAPARPGPRPGATLGAWGGPGAPRWARLGSTPAPTASRPLSTRFHPYRSSEVALPGTQRGRRQGLPPTGRLISHTHKKKRRKLTKLFAVGAKVHGGDRSFVALKVTLQNRVLLGRKVVKF